MQEIRSRDVRKLEYYYSSIKPLSYGIQNLRRQSKHLPLVPNLWRCVLQQSSLKASDTNYA
jgi:hypothetical protein